MKWGACLVVVLLLFSACRRVKDLTITKEHVVSVDTSKIVIQQKLDTSFVDPGVNVTDSVKLVTLLPQDSIITNLIHKGRVEVKESYNTRTKVLITQVVETSKVFHFKIDQTTTIQNHKITTEDKAVKTKEVKTGSNWPLLGSLLLAIMIVVYLISRRWK